MIGPGDVSPSSAEKLIQSIPAGHQTHSELRKPPLPITSPKKPISQAEFQALIDAGYKVPFRGFIDISIDTRAIPKCLSIVTSSKIQSHHHDI